LNVTREVRWARWRKIRIVSLTASAQIAFALARAIGRDRREHILQIGISTEALGQTGESVTAEAGAVAAGEPHHDIGIIFEPAIAHGNIV